MEQFYEHALEELPNEVLYEIVLKMKPDSILKLCLTSKQFSRICADEYIWIKLLKRDFPDYPIVGDPKEHYRKLVQGEGEKYGPLFIPGNRYPEGTRVVFARYQIVVEAGIDFEPVYSNYSTSFNINSHDILKEISEEVLDGLESLDADMDVDDSLFGTILLTQFGTANNVGRFNDPDFLETANKREFIAKFTKDMIHLSDSDMTPAGESLSYRFDDHDIEVYIVRMLVSL